MIILIKVIIGFIALLHLYFLWLEMFAWTTRGPKVFQSVERDLFPKTKVMAANQGLYNGFLAAGLLWTFFICDMQWHKNISLFFLGCIFVAGLYGAITVDKKIFHIQGLPAMIGIILLLLQ